MTKVKCESKLCYDCCNILLLIGINANMSVLSMYSLQQHQFNCCFDANFLLECSFFTLRNMLVEQEPIFLIKVLVCAMMSEYSKLDFP